MSLTLISSNIKEIDKPSWWTGSCFCGIDRWMGRCGQPWQLKLLTDQDTWDAYVGAGIFCFDSSPSLVWPFLRRFVDFLSDSFFPFLLSLAIMVSPAFCWVIAAAGRRNGFINRSFTSTTLYSFTGGEDKGRGRRMMLLEMLVTRGTSLKSSWRTGKLLWRLWKTICEEPERLGAQYVL